MSILQAPSEPLVSESIYFPGLRAFFDRLLDDIAVNAASDRLNFPAVLNVIQQTAQRLNHSIGRDQFEPQHLTSTSRVLLGWFRYFADQDALQAYVDALVRCREALHAAQGKKLRWPEPLLIHFRPSSHLYRWHRQQSGTRIVLPPPMICFDHELFQQLAQSMLHRRVTATAISTATHSPAYRDVADRIDMGPVEHPKGKVYDLADSFERVNREYFDSQLPRPMLTWSHRITHRKFGHYDLLRDTIMISRTLDRADVPSFVLDHVMHHELLHKKHGVVATPRRRCFHTPAFRAEERSFPQYEQADRFLNQLARVRSC